MVKKQNQPNKEIDVEKLKIMSASLHSLIEYYDDSEDIDVYLYDIIACILLSSNSKEVSDKKKISFDSFVIALLLKADSNNEICFKRKDLVKVIKIIDNIKLSNELYEILLRKFALKESETDILYKKNLYTTTEREKKILNLKYEKVITEQQKIQNNIYEMNEYIIYNNTDNIENKNNNQINEDNKKHM